MLRPSKLPPLQVRRRDSSTQYPFDLVPRHDLVQRIAEFEFIPPKSTAKRVLENPAQYARSRAYQFWLRHAPKLNQTICVTAATLYVNGYTVESMARNAQALFKRELSRQLIYRAIRLVLLGPRQPAPKKGRPARYKPRVSTLKSKRRQRA